MGKRNVKRHDESIDVQDDLERVEHLLREAVASSEPLVHEAATHLLAAGGKRFRPMLVLLCGHLGNPADPRPPPRERASW